MLVIVWACPTSMKSYQKSLRFCSRLIQTCLHHMLCESFATTGQTYTFQTPRQYLHFVLSITPRRLLTEVAHTRYIELSSQYDNDVYFHASVTYTVAAITRNLVVLHRMKSDETSVRFELSRAEMTALISGYQSYLDHCEQEEAEAETTRDPFLDFPDDFA